MYLIMLIQIVLDKQSVLLDKIIKTNNTKYIDISTVNWIYLTKKTFGPIEFNINKLNEFEGEKYLPSVFNNDWFIF